MDASAVIDEAAAVRAGEELDVAAVDAWLKGRMRGLLGAPEVRQYPGGASNWTYRLRYEDRDLILRRPPAGTRARSAHDMEREYQVQAALKPVYPWVPNMVALCLDESVVGVPFYVMDRLVGIIPRKSLPEPLRSDTARVRRLCLGVVDKLVDLHRVRYQGTPLEALGKGRGYAKRQVEGWSGRFIGARTWNVPGYRDVMDWLRSNAPEDVGTCVIHNDWRLDNMVLDPADPTRVIGVLDWEMATLGDPLMDLGSALAYWVQADDDVFGRATRRQPTHLPGMLTRREVVEHYLGRTGTRAENWTFYEVYGLFRLAVIVQQIYYRYHLGQTRNPAFRRFWMLSHYLHWRCRRLLRSSERS